MTRNTPHNKELLMEYFLREFSGDPEDFYNFLQFLKRQLKKNPKAAESITLAQKYLDMLMPLCERFGFTRTRDNLNDICFAIISPAEYRRIHEVLLRYQKDHGRIIQNISRVLRKTLVTEGYTHQVIGRYKNLYRIAQKMKQKNNQDIFSLRDIFGFRIVLPGTAIEPCFEVLNFLHDRFRPMPERFKDYISIPKINGYQSLHTGLKEVLPDFDLPIEVQIRTEQMNEFAEKGVAAHWVYVKEKNLPSRQKFSSSIFLQPSQVSDEFIYPLSCDGDIFKLEQGSTVLDFAYQVHTDLGNRTEYGLINGKTKDISTPLRDGDSVKIMGGKKLEVCKKWLGCAHNRLTIRKIQSFL